MHKAGNWAKEGRSLQLLSAVLWSTAVHSHIHSHEQFLQWNPVPDMTYNVFFLYFLLVIVSLVVVTTVVDYLERVVAVMTK